MADHGDDKEPYYADFTKSKGPASPFQKQVLDIIYWKDAKVTGGILSGGVLLYLLTNVRGYTYIALGSIVLLMHLMISIVMGQLQKFQGKAVPEGKPIQIDPEYLKVGMEGLNKALEYYCGLLDGKDMNGSLKVMGGLWVSYCLGTWFDGATLLLLAWIAILSVPIGYHKNHKVIDAKLAILQNKVNDLTKQLESKVPRAAKKEDAKDN